MDVLEIVFSLAVLLFAYLGPFLRKLVQKRIGEPSGEAMDLELSPGEDPWSGEGLELEFAPTPPAPAQTRPARRQPHAARQAPDVHPAAAVGIAPDRRGNGQLIAEVVILEAFLSPPRSAPGLRKC